MTATTSLSGNSSLALTQNAGVLLQVHVARKASVRGNHGIQSVSQASTSIRNASTR